MKTEFTIHSDIQAFVEHKVNVGGKEKKDTLFVNIDNKELKIILSIEDKNLENNSEFIISSEHFQKIVDWLKVKKIIK